jgi:hypothetical protein
VVRTCVIPGPQRTLRKPSWTGSGPGITGDCLEFAGTTPASTWPSERVPWC